MNFISTPVENVETNRSIAVHYLGHSAWLVETARRLIVLDYGELPVRNETADALLSQGCLDLSSPQPAWLGASNKPVFVFASHRHRDHVHPRLQEWLLGLPGDGHAYVLGLDKNDPDPVFAKSSPRIHLVRPHERHIVQDCEILSFASTDMGVAILARWPEITIYHGGDLACWTDEAQYARPHVASVTELARVGWPVDLAFIPVCTSDGYQDPPLVAGALATLQALKPKLVFPMHGFTFEHLYQHFADLLPEHLPSFTGLTRVAANPGDCFVEVLNGK